MSGAHVGWSLLAILMQLGPATGLMRMRGEFWRGGNGLGWGNGVLGRWLNVMNYTGAATPEFRQSAAAFTTVGLTQVISRDTDNWEDFMLKVPDSLKVSHDLGVSHLDKYIMAIIFIALAAFEIVVERIGMETKLRGYMLFITLLLFLTMLVDITALTEPAKKALMEGLSTGIGLSVGAFAVWFFFHEYLDKVFKKKRSS